MLEQEVKGLAHLSMLLKKQAGLWRAPDGEDKPTPCEGEIICFTNHVDHGLNPPGSKFLYELLNYYGLRLHYLAPNSILHVFAFTFLCEAYLGIELLLPLWPELFYCKK
jgi:hypothetical protein